MSSLHLAYLPLAVVACLAFAVGEWRRDRCRALLAGLAAAAAYALLSLVVTVARVALQEPALGLRPPAALALAIELLYRILVNAPGMEYAVPAFLWLVALAASPGGAPGRGVTGPRR